MNFEKWPEKDKIEYLILKTQIREGIIEWKAFCHKKQKDANAFKSESS